MRTQKCWSAPVLLFASAIPVFGYAASGAPKGWFHFPRGSSARPQQQDIYPAVKHFVANHPKPARTRNLHPRESKQNKPS
jgi:hypothetical protein